MSACRSCNAPILWAESAASGKRMPFDDHEAEPFSAGAFAVVLEMVPADVAKRVTAELVVPTIGIGAGPDCDAQVLVWSDMAGMNRGRTPKFVKRYAQVGDVLLEAARAFAGDVRGGEYPDADHSYS